MSVPVTVVADPVLKEQLRNLEEKNQLLTEELGRAHTVLQQIGPPTASPEVLLQTLKTKAEAFEEQRAKMLQQEALAETLTKKVNDLEAELANAGKTLDTPQPLDKVYVTAIQSRTAENGNVVVACTMHHGLESEPVVGTILIPQSEFNKLRPQKQM
jgi:Tfp pilus assembly protein PilN